VDGQRLPHLGLWRCPVLDANFQVMIASEAISTGAPKQATERRLSSLVAAIYDAAFDPERWSRVLADSAIFVGGCAAALCSRDDVYQWGLDPHYVQLYRHTYISFDPVVLGYSIADIEEPISTVDVIPRDRFLTTRFYKEWAQPQGFVDSVHTILEEPCQNAIALMVFRHERDGLVDDEMRWHMRLLAPHFRRAILIGKLVDLNKIGITPFADVLDAINAAIFLVDATGCLVHANAAGGAMLSATSPLRIADKHLAGEDQDTDRALCNAFARASNRNAKVDTKGIVVPLLALGREVHKGEHYAGHVFPLSSQVRRSGQAGCAPTAVLFVHKAALRTSSAPEAIAKAYKLTAMELRVLLAIFDVGGVPEVAEALGVAESTVKTHLGRIFDKTNSKRQADLVKLVASFANLFVG